MLRHWVIISGNRDELATDKTIPRGSGYPKVHRLIPPRADGKTEFGV